MRGAADVLRGVEIAELVKACKLGRVVTEERSHALADRDVVAQRAGDERAVGAKRIEASVACYARAQA